MKTLLIALGMVAVLDTSAFAESKVKWPDCYCTDKTGSRVELGQVICMNVGGRSFMARCEMSLNNPMWRETGESCLSSRNKNLPQSLDPHFDSGTVNTKV